MNSYRNWKINTNQKLRRKALEDRDSHMLHSHAFHSYFEGYKEYREADEHGRIKIRRVYEGTTYKSKLSNLNYWMVRLLYIALYAFMIFTIVFSAKKQGTSGNAIYLVIFEIATIIGLAWLFYTLLASYVFAPKLMTIGDYKSSNGSIKSAGKYLGVCFIADGIMTVVYGITHSIDSNLVAVIIMWLMAAAAAIIIYEIESTLPYEEIIPDHSPDDDVTQGIEIEY